MEDELTMKNDEEAVIDEELIALSMNLIVGLTLANTLKLRGKIQEEEVIGLVDSGASHNFISHDLVPKRGLPVEESKAFGVMVGNGFTIQGMGVCRRLELAI